MGEFKEFLDSIKPNSVYWPFALVPPPAPANGLLTVKQVADRLGKSTDNVLGYIHTGSLKAVNVGKGMQRGRYRVSEDDLQEFLQRRTTRA